MSTIDPKQAERVWSRVMGASCPMSDAPKQKPPMCEQAQGLNEKTLLELLEDELQDHATYCHLACMARGCVRQTLQSIAADEKQHAKMLSAMYYILTGKKACPEHPRPACVACLNEALREQYAGELEGSRRYAEVARRAGEHACTFERLAADECRHAQMLYCLLQKCL